jgi:hypothetical protein
VLVKTELAKTAFSRSDNSRTLVKLEILIPSINLIVDNSRILGAVIRFFHLRKPSRSIRRGSRRRNRQRVQVADPA